MINKCWGSTFQVIREIKPNIRKSEDGEVWVNELIDFFLKNNAGLGKTTNNCSLKFVYGGNGFVKYIMRERAKDSIKGRSKVKITTCFALTNQLIGKFDFVLC